MKLNCLFVVHPFYSLFPVGYCMRNVVFLCLCAIKMANLRKIYRINELSRCFVDDMAAPDIVG